MISRRRLFALSAAAAATPLLTNAVANAATGAVSRAAAVPEKFTLRLVNNSGAGSAYAYVIGTTIEEPGKLIVVRPDGSSYFPPNPSQEGTPLGEDCAIPLGASGSTKEIEVPRMKGARAYIVTDSKLDFFVNPGPSGPALVSPSFLNTSDANYKRNWSFAEFTFNDRELYANISYVDFVSIPIGISLTTLGGQEQKVAGLPGGALDSIAQELKAQAASEGTKWDQLIQTGPDGRPLRVVSAHYKAAEFQGYLEGYIDEVWKKYEGATLTIDSQNGALGKVTGKVSGGRFTFSSGDSFGKPSTADVLSCDTGPFKIDQGATEIRKSIIPRLAAALNRTTLLDNADQPQGEDAAKFYQKPRTNHYARIVHSKLPDNRGYAFPYDDVAPTGKDFSGAVHAGDPKVLTVAFGPTHK
ncbi:glycoside hydrolase family 64 protein [Allokutzneria oryzae]|uniref:Glycoside hydrolase family 64 protein n=1 Tax=Allokutzneria oryzae TaxID=1378989 RepID=A0ABV5ZRX5_9PSEU